MTKIFVSLAALAALTSFNFTSAAACGELIDPLDPALGVQMCGNGEITPQSQMPWGMNGELSPIVTAGATIVDPSGFVDVCPTFYGKMGCVDFTKTTYYKNKMVETANYLKNRGTLNQFPRFQFWVK